MQYNTQRTQLIIPEYGRHVQSMVNQCLEIQDKEKRNNQAKAIIEVMGVLNPHLRDVPDFQHKLWDHLHIMSNYQLEVDSPFPQPIKEELTKKPDRMPYPKANSQYKYYGDNIKKMIQQALTWEEGEKKEALIYVIANHMKKCYLNWNKDTVEDQVIFNHLKELSNGKIDLTNQQETLSASEKLLSLPTKKNKKKNKR